MKEDIENVLGKVYNGPLQLSRMKLTELQFLKEKVVDCDRRLNELE